MLMPHLSRQTSLAITLIILLPVIVIILLLIFESFHPNYFLYDDNTTIFLPYYIYNWNALINHDTLPLINFHQYLGHTYLALGTPAVFYAPVYISVFLSNVITRNAYYTIDILAFIHLAIASIGMFLLLKRLRISTTICFLSSLVWISYPFIVNVSRTWVFVSYTAAFLPFNFLLLEKLISDLRLRNALFLALIKAAFFYAGYVQYLFITFVFEVFYIFLKIAQSVFSKTREKNEESYNVMHSNSRLSRDNIRKLITSYFSSTFSFICLSAPLLVPMIFIQQESALRSSKVTLKNFLSWPIFFSDFFKAQFLDFKPDVIFAGDSEIYYFGFVNLLLLILIISKRFRKNFRIVVFALFAFIALFCSTEFYKAFYYIPGFNLFRWPFKNFIFFLFFATIGVAGITNILIQQKIKWQTPLTFGIHFILVLSILLNCFVLWKSSGREHVFATIRIDNPPENHLENYVSNQEGRIITLWVNKIKSKDRYKYLTYNFATLFGYFHFGGYSMLVSKLNNRLSLGLNHINSYRGAVNMNLLNYLSFMSVRYIVTHDNIYTRRLANLDQLKLRYQGENILLYENLKALPLVYFLDDPSKAVDFYFDINEINIYPNNSSVATLVINSAPLRWFQIYADGVKAGGIKHGEYPIKVKVPPGTKKLTLRYEDYSFYSGVLIFVLFWMALVSYRIFSKLSKTRSNE